MSPQLARTRTAQRSKKLKESLDIQSCVAVMFPCLKNRESPAVPDSMGSCAVDL